MSDVAQLVSVIMPTYDHADFIGQAIESVLDQSYDALELVVVDNYSVDKTEEIVERFAKTDDRIRYTKFRNQGIIAASRNCGVRESRGDLIAFLDSDDVWHRSKLMKQVECLNDRRVVGVGTDATFIASTPFYRELRFGRGRHGYVDYTYRDILKENPVRTSSVVVRKDVVMDIGGFDERPDFRFVEDWDLWLRMARKGIFRILEDRLLIYRVFTDVQRDRVETAERYFRVLDKHIALGYVKQEDIAETRATINLAIASSLLHVNDVRCRGLFRQVMRESSDIGKMLRAVAGYSLAFLPLVVRHRVLRCLYAADRLCRTFGDAIWRAYKVFLWVKRDSRATVRGP